MTAADNSPSPPGQDDGVATVFACLAVLTLLAVTFVGLRLGAVTVARHRAEAAADMAALAAARLAPQGLDQACAAADQLSTRNGARLVDCRTTGLDVLVTVRIEMSLAGLRGAAQAHARAGPLDAETAGP